MFSCFVIPFRCLFGVCEFRGVHKIKSNNASEIEQRGEESVKGKRRKRDRDRETNENERQGRDIKKSLATLQVIGFFPVLFLFQFSLPKRPKNSLISQFNQILHIFRCSVIVCINFDAMCKSKKILSNEYLAVNLIRIKNCSLFLPPDYVFLLFHITPEFFYNLYLRTYASN